MRRRLIPILLCVLIVFSCLPLASALGFTDTDEHWAKQYIDNAVELGLFQGTTETTFSPDETMTRAMFVTVLGRIAGVDTTVWSSHQGYFFSDVAGDQYYAPYVAWAYCNDITNGTGKGCFSPTQPVTRQEMACFLVNYFQAFDYQLPVSQEPPAPFSDSADIADWAVEKIEALQASGILLGSADGQGGYAYLPLDNATRAECAVVFCKTLDYLFHPGGWEDPASVTGVALEPEALDMTQADVQCLCAVVFPYETASQNVRWYSTDRAVAMVDEYGCVTAVGGGSAQIYAVARNGMYAVCTVNVTPLPMPAPDEQLTYEQKCIMLFGRVVDDPRVVYSTKEEAQADMETIRVSVWDLNSNGEKYTRQMYLQVHKNLVSRVTAVFEEIYALPEQPPIHSLGGYRWGDTSKSEHTSGLAIDINYNENYYCKPDGTAIVGDHFSPETDPYSIPVEGSIDRIFAKYGFTRGIYWHSGYKDYMHYSFFGT